VTILLTDAQTTSLDQASINILRTSGARLSRSAMVRSITRAALRFHQEWQHCESEEQLFNILYWMLKGDRE